MNLYDKASLIITPNAYKASKIYAAKPTSGAGDLTFARASAQTRTNASGVIENLANNVPALDYPTVGGCPWWNFPVQRTNLFFNSAWVNSGGLPTDWSLGGTGAAVPNGLDPTYQSSLGVTKYLFTAVAQQPVLFRSVSVVSGNTYVLSVEIKSFTGTLTYGDVLFATGAFYSSSTLRMNGVVVSAATTVNQTGVLELILVANASGNSTMRVGAGALFVDRTCTIELSAPQVEIGSFRSPVIITPVGSTLTRVIANPNTSGLTSFIGQTEGVFSAIFRTQSTVQNGDLLGINQNTTNSILYVVSGGTLRAVIYAGGVSVILIGPTVVANTTYNCAVRYVSGNPRLVVNGVEYTATTTFSFSAALTSLNFLNDILIGPRPNVLFGEIGFYPALTNAELVALTTRP